MIYAAVVLSFAALGGITMAAIRLNGAPRPPTFVALGHGAIALTGVAILAYSAVTPGLPQAAQISLGLFVLAALGGTSIFAMFHVKNLPLPIPLVLGHGLLALTALGLLWASVYAVI